jgi:hypothetical protein
VDIGVGPEGEQARDPILGAGEIVVAPADV